MSKRIVLTLLAVGILFWTIFAYPTAVLLLHYYSLKASTQPDSVNWSTKAIHDELWQPVAAFSYTINGQNYHKKEVFQKERFRNPYAANAALTNLNKTYRRVWYAPNNPTKASMEKFYPIKNIIYSLLILGLIFYGVWFSYRISNR